MKYGLYNDDDQPAEKRNEIASRKSVTSLSHTLTMYNTKINRYLCDR